MARTIAEINDSIIAGIGNQTELSVLNSTSKVAIYRLFAYVISVAMWIHENLWDQAKAELEALVNYAIPGTAQWYRQKAFDFQLNDSLEALNNFQVYNTIDESKQIVKYASATESLGTLVLKVAKETNGQPAKLDTNELDAFTAYIGQVKFAGTKVFCRSGDPEQISIAMKVYYNPLYISENGTQIGDNGVSPVEDAINQYVTNLPWNGKFYNSTLVDVVQKVNGVVDVELVSVKVIQNSVETAITRIYEPFYGYFSIEDFNDVTYISSND